MEVQQASFPPRAKRAVVVQKSADPEQSQPVYTAMALDGTSVTFRSVTEFSLFTTLTPEKLAAALKASGDPSPENKADQPEPPKGLTADQAWERGTGGVKRAVPGVLVALTPTAASAMSGPEIGSYVVQQLKIPQSIATPVGETVKTLSTDPIFRYLFIFAGVFLAVFGLGSKIRPDKPARVIAFWATGLALLATGLYALI